MSQISDDPKLIENFIYKELMINNEKYLVGTSKNKDVQQVILTNLKDFYQESLTKESTEKRCKELNPLLSDCKVPDEVIEKIIEDLLLNIPKHTVSATLECIKLAKKIDGGDFLFEIKLEKTSADHFFNDFIENFFFSISELHQRYNFLINIVKRKDEEINEYKAQGVEILRPSLQTIPFDEKLFNNKLESSKYSDKIDIFSNIMSFYDSIKHLQNKVNVNKETVQTKEESNESGKQKNSCKRKIKTSSSELRCAVDPKFEHKAKVSKKNPGLKYL